MQYILNMYYIIDETVVRLWPNLNNNNNNVTSCVWLVGHQHTHTHTHSYVNYRKLKLELIFRSSQCEAKKKAKTRKQKPLLVCIDQKISRKMHTQGGRGPTYASIFIWWPSPSRNVCTVQGNRKRVPQSRALSLFFSHSLLVCFVVGGCFIKHHFRSNSWRNPNIQSPRGHPLLRRPHALCMHTLRARHWKRRRASGQRGGWFWSTSPIPPHTSTTLCSAWPALTYENHERSHTTPKYVSPS